MTPRTRLKRTVATVGLIAMTFGTLQLTLAPAATAAVLFTDDFTAGNMSSWTSVTRVTVDAATGSPAAPSARAQVTNQSASAYRNLTSPVNQACMSTNVNMTSSAAVDIFRLRTATGGPIIKANKLATGNLQIRSDFGSTTRNSGVALGTGWHNVELCGTVGTTSTWDLYRDGVLIVNDWAANTGTTGIGRVQIGDTAAKTFTANWDHVVLDQAPGDEGGGTPGDTTAPTVPGRPAGSSPGVGSIQISWTASSDASPPISYRVFRDGGTTAIGTTTQTSFTDTNAGVLTAGSGHTYQVDATDSLGNGPSARSQASLTIVVQSAPPAGGQPVPGHTRIPPDTARPNMPRITAGEITDLAYIGNRIYVVGTFTQIQNNTATNTTTYNQPHIAAFNLDTGLVDANFRPTFGGGGVTEVEASPDGTKLFVVGRFNTVNGVTRRKIASINPTTGATVTGFTANAGAAATAVEATNSTVYVGGQFLTVNGTSRVGMVAVNANTGALVNGFQNNLSGGIGVNGMLTVQALALSPDSTKLLVVHTARQIAGQDRYGVGLIDTTTNQLLPWRTRLWDDNLQFVGGIQRIYAGAIAPNGQYFVVSSGSGGDRPPISDTAIAYPIAGGDNVEPLWISRNFDSVYSVAIAENAVYVGGHMNYMESPTAPDPWPGLTDVGYGRGQGLAGYGLGDDIVLREHLGALDPATGKAIEWDPGSNSFEGNKAMLALPRGIITGGDGNTQGGANGGRIAIYDFNQIPAVGPNETTITEPIKGRVEEADVPFVINGTATAASGVQRVQLEIRDRDSGQYLQDNLTTWGAANTINVNLVSPNATSTLWNLQVTISGNRRLMLMARTYGLNGSNDASKAEKKIETFGLADETPTTSINGPSGSIIPTTTFTTTGTANDDLGISAINFSFRDSQNRYLQDDGDVGTVYNTFRGLPDVIGATSATWSYEVTVPYESEWTMQAIAVDTSGQSDLRSATRSWLVAATAIPPEVNITAPAVMNPPTSIPALTMAPGAPLTFSGSANDDEDLVNVEIRLSNSVTRENLDNGCTWGTNVSAGWCRISPQSIPGQSYNWSWTTPFNLRPGTYSFSVRATDDLNLSTSSTNQGRLTINVQVPGDAFPNATISPTGTQSNWPVQHLDLVGAATDDKGVSAVRLTIEDRDTGRYVQPNGTMSAAYALLNATLASPGATSTAWSLSLDLPTQGDFDVTAFAYDTADQQDPSTSGATSRYIVYPGDLPPVFVDGLFSPPEGTVFTDGRIQVSGRLEDDQQIAEAEVAIRNAAGLYMNSSGSFTSTSTSWRGAFLNSPGSPGSNFSYTSPPIPAGAYTVFARGEDQHGFTTTVPMERNVTVTVPPNNPPVASFTFGCNQNVCDFDGRSSTDEKPTTLVYSWTFGTGQGSGSGPIPRRTYTAPGTFTVTLTVRDEWNVSSTPVSQTVTIVEPAGNVAPIPVINPPSCVARTCNFSGVGSADPNVGDTFTYLWNFGDGTPTSTSTSPSHTFPADGTFPVSLTVTDGWGNAATTTLQVTRNEPAGNAAPTAVISTPVCVARVCSFSGLTSADPNGDPFTYAWTFGDGGTSTSSAPTRTYAAAGTYTVTLITTDGWGNISTTATTQVTVA